MRDLVRDISNGSGYWAAIWTMSAMPDVHIIADAPIGCFNLVATAIPDYTDAIPEIANVTPAVIREAEVTEGTSQTVRDTYEEAQDAGLLDGKHLIVVSTATSEMIGSDLSSLVTQFQPGTQFYHSDSLNEDEYVGRDRALKWLWDTYGGAEVDVEPGLVNIIGPTYGCFNSPSDLVEIKRLIEGAGGRVNLVFPFESRLDQIDELARAQVNIVLYKEFGSALAETLGQPWLYAPFGIQETTAFIRRLGELLGTEATARAFIAQEKRTTLKAVWDLWRGPQGDWFGTTTIGVVAGRSYAEGLKAYLGDELGMPITLAVARPNDADNEAVRQVLHDSPPSFVYGSINERIYLSEAGATRTNFIYASFPGPVVRRSVGTPFMGYRGAVHLVQEIVNRLYDALFSFLPLDSAYTSGGSQPAAGNLPWQPEAKALLDKAVETMPFLARISASRELQMRVEAQARAQGIDEVTSDLAASILATQRE